MKIAVISNGATSLLNFRGPLLEEMVRRGYQVLAFAPDYDENSRQTLRAMGVEPLDCSMGRSSTNPLRELFSIFELHRQLRRHRPDICFAYFLKPVIYGTIAAWLAGIKRRYGLIAGLGFAFTVGQEASSKRKLLQNIVTILARFSLGRIDRIMFQNPDDLEEFQARGILKEGKAELVGATGVDLEQWPVTPLPDRPITFLLTARLLRDKGITEYVAAARILRRTYPEARFLLLGGLDDNLAAIAREEVESWVAEGLIEWPGHVQVRPWLNQAHIFVLPSYREGLPRSTQEAMAMGRPVVTTDVPGCRETVIDGLNGFLVPTQNPESLASAMQRFLDNPELIESMGQESRRLAEERFDVHAQNRKLLGLMDI